VDADWAGRAGDLADDLSESLRAEGIAVRDGFLSASQVRELIECSAARRDRGEFVHARIGAGGSLQRRADIRGDSICWLEAPLLPAEHALFELMENTRRRLNLGYTRHIDQPRGCASRRLSSIVYLNEDWREADGGMLLCRADDGGFREIEPLGGRLVVFLTEGREHEVLPTSRERLSITGWFLGRQEHGLR
jgi:SM-20-related protein